MKEPTRGRAKRQTLSDEAREMFRAWGRQGGQKRSRRLSSEERKAQARRAVKARWGRAKPRDESKARRGGKT
jgi:hypothetical protein